MIQMQTVLEAADNSGAKNLRCIKVLGGSKKRYARVGDIIVASIKDSIPNSRVKAGDVVKAVIVRTKKNFADRMVPTLNLIKMLQLSLIIKESRSAHAFLAL